MARNKALNEKMRENRRQKILSGALKLFSSRGFAAAKISDIAEETGMSQGLVYHYYRSKDDIFVDLIRYAFDRLRMACDYLKNDTRTVRERIVFAIDELVKGLKEHEDHHRYYLIIAMASASDAIPQEARIIIHKERDYPYQVMEMLFREGQKEGGIRKQNPRDQAVMFWTQIIGLAIYRSSHGASGFNPDASVIYNMFIKE